MNMTIVKQHKAIRQFILYVMIGTIAVATDNIIFIMLRHLEMNMYISNFIAVNCGLAVSFTLNARINFKRKDNIAKRAVRFYSVGYLGLLLSMMILDTGIKYLAINEVYIKLFSTILVGIFQYTFNKLVTFKEI